ncbi:glycosyltransferase family 4 protein [Calditrichota bacterium LG25]
MRIGMILDREFPPDHRVEKEAKSLIKNGHEVHLFCFNHGHLKSEETINGIKVHRFFLSRQLFKKLYALINVFPLYNMFWKRKLMGQIKKYDIQALHVHDLPLSHIAWQLSKKFGIPLVLDMHEDYADWIEQTPHYNTLVGRIVKKLSRWKPYEKKHLQLADYVIGVSPVLIDKMVKQYRVSRDKIIFVPNTPEPDFMTPDKIDEDIKKQLTGRFNVIYVGGISYLRGLQKVIPYMREVEKRIPEIQFIIVGDGTYLPELKKLTKELNLDHIVYFAGWETVERIAAYIKLSHVGIYPSLRYKGVDDKVPTKVFQYWALGKPVIAPDFILPRTMIAKHQSGFTIDFEKEGEKLVDLVEKLYRDEKLRETMGENGRRAIEEEWNWEKTVQPLIDLYDHLSKKREEKL